MTPMHGLLAHIGAPALASVTGTVHVSYPMYVPRQGSSAWPGAPVSPGGLPGPSPHRSPGHLLNGEALQLPPELGRLLSALPPPQVRKPVRAKCIRLASMGVVLHSAGCCPTAQQPAAASATSLIDRVR